VHAGLPLSAFQLFVLQLQINTHPTVSTQNQTFWENNSFCMAKKVLMFIHMHLILCCEFGEQEF
jgi:hypothetical protein